MDRIRALVAAAGRGSRAGLPYPKTLFPVGGSPILLRIVGVLAGHDACPTIVASPEGLPLIQDLLDESHVRAHLVCQPSPRGMGDAVLRFADSPAFDVADHVLLMWGDLPFVRPETIAQVVSEHMLHGNDFTFPTRVVDAPYTVVSRDSDGAVTGLVETRQSVQTVPERGERDIGLFVFRKALVFELLREDLPDKWGPATGEHGFLYVVAHLAARGHKVVALPIALQSELISLNRLADVDGASVAGGEVAG